MKKKLLCLLGVSLLAIGLGACGNKGGEGGEGGNTPVQPTTTKYTVAFEVDGERRATLKVDEGQTITSTISNPTKDGYVFVGWYEGETLVDLSTYVVTHNVVFTAKFEEDTRPQLDVDAVKEADHTYYLVLGWWETTALDTDGVTPKRTSYLTRTHVRDFYRNLINFLKANGATDENIANIQFRNYSSDTVALMGQAINTDGDVDIMIGVGNNINSDAAVALYSGSNDYKFQTKMGEQPTDPTKENKRYVACTSVATELGVKAYEWLKFTDAGRNSFLKELTDAEITASSSLNLAVTVHGETDAVTTLDDYNDVITMPEIEVPESYQFVGFATSADGEAVLKVKADAELTYKNIYEIVTDGQETLDLYPVFEELKDDLVVYVQNNSSLSLAEAGLLEARFNSTLTNKRVNFKVQKDAKQNDMYTAIDGLQDADVIVGARNVAGDTSKYAANAHAQGQPVKSGAKHFADASRYVMIPQFVKDDHLDLAKTLYNFLTTEAVAYSITAAFWQKADKTWVSDDNVTAIMSGMEARAKTFLGLADSDSLVDKYNVSFAAPAKVTTIDDQERKDRVADLTRETQALNGGKGVDLIIGCGGNIDEQTGYIDIPKKAISDSAHTFVVGSSRYVALPHDNALARDIFDNYFVLPTA